MGDGKARKIVFIDKRFQGDFILKFVLLLLVGTAIFNLAAYLILDRRLGDTYYNAHIVFKSTGEILLPTLLALSAVFIVVLGAAAILITLYVSHHIAGPLYAIRRYLESIAQGDLDFKPHLRLNDQTTPLAESLSRAVDTLNARLVAIKTGADAVHATSAALSSHVAGCDGVSPECRKELGDLLAREDAMLREMEFFHLRAPGAPPAP